MPNYRRNRVPGGCYFFTITSCERHQNTLLIDQIDLLRAVVKQAKATHPFHIDGWVVLPEHMHFILTLPKGDDNFVKRIRLIKTLFSKRLPKTEYRSTVRQRRNERGIQGLLTLILWTCCDCEGLAVFEFSYTGKSTDVSAGLGGVRV